jgi:hypothetical protein
MSAFKIQVDSNNNVISDPILLDNLLAIYKKEPIPSYYVDFVSAELPNVGLYEVIDGYTYIKIDNYYTKQYIIRAMTDDEIQNKQDEVKTSWDAVGYPSWIFNESKCCFEPPVVNPSTLNYEWDEESNQWVIVE